MLLLISRLDFHTYLAGRGECGGEQRKKEQSQKYACARSGKFPEMLHGARMHG